MLRILPRYPNFAMGSTHEHEIVAVASCCTQGMRLRATDVAGVEAAVETEFKVLNGPSPTSFSFIFDFSKKHFNFTNKYL